METQTLKLTDIRTDGGTQTRVGINHDAVIDYSQSLKDGIVLPVVDVFYDGEVYWLADGFHRLSAAKLAGKTELEAIVHLGTARDARLFGFSCNNGHGVRKSNADKKAQTEAMLTDQEWSTWSQAAIARHIGVTAEYVSRVKKELSIDRSIDRHTVTVKRGDGEYKMQTRAIGQKSAPITRVNDGDVFYEETAIQREEVSSLPDVSNRSPITPFHTSQKINTPLNNTENRRLAPVMSTPDSKSDHMAVNGYTQPGPAANTTVSMVEEIARLRKEVETLTTEKQAADDLITVLRAENTTLKGQLEAARKLEIKPVMATLAKQWDTPLDEVNALISSMTERKVPLTDATTRVSAALEFYLKVGFQPPPEYKRIDLLGTLIASIEPEKKVKKPTIPAAQMTEMKNAIAAAFNWEHSTISQSTWGEIQKTAKELIELKVDPTTLCYGHRYCKGKFDSFRPAALVKWYAEWVKLVPKKPVDVPEDQKDIPMPDWAREAYNKVMASFNS